MNFYLVVILVLFIFKFGDTGKAKDTDYTSEEISAIEELRKVIEDELEEDYMRMDEYLINFLRAKKLNIPKTSALIKETMKWWRDTDMSSIMDESYPTFEKQYPYKLNFVDKEGRPVILMSFGKWNLRNLIISGQRSQYLRYYDQMLEKTLTKVREIRKNSGEDVNRFMIIADMNSYSFTTHGCLNCVPLILDFAKHLDNYYAARAIRIYTINTPRLFIPVFELIKPLLSETTAKGFKIFGSNKEEWKGELLKVIPRTELPVEYGGTAKKKSKTTTTTSTTSTTTILPNISKLKTTKKTLIKPKPEPSNEVSIDEEDCE